MAELDAGDPQQIGSYALLGRLGSGGMGQVFLGRSQGGRLVAVKVIHAHLASDPAFRARFAREVASARKVSGMFTAPVVDADLDGPAPWLVTAYVPGPSLADAVAASGPLTGTSVAALAAGLAEGLGAIHAAGVIHRDLKPSNVLLAADGPRIIDFGIASAAEATALTGAGFMIGSPGFMSPEQAQGHPIGPASDIFSLAAVIAFAATGTGPFGIGDSAALLYRVVHGKPDLSHVSGPLGALLRRSLAKNPARRPTAPRFLTELTSAYPAMPAFAGDWLPRQASTPPTPTPIPPPHQVNTADPAPSAPAPSAPAPSVPAPSAPAPSGPAQAAPPWAAPPQVPPAPAASPRRRLWPWAAAAAAVCAAVIVTLVISLTPGPKPGTPPATAAGHTSTARPQTTPQGRSPSAATSPARSGPASATRHLRLAQLRTGDCLTGSNLGLGTNNPWPGLTTAVPCGQSHIAEVFFADHAYWAGSYPGDSTLTQAADAKCGQVFGAYVGIPDTNSAYNWDDIYPSATDWSGGERELVCVAYHPTSSAPGGTPVTGSLKGSRR